MPPYCEEHNMYKVPIKGKRCCPECESETKASKPMRVDRVYLDGCRIWPLSLTTDPFEIFKEKEKWGESRKED